MADLRDLDIDANQVLEVAGVGVAEPPAAPNGRGGAGETTTDEVDDQTAVLVERFRQEDQLVREFDQLGERERAVRAPVGQNAIGKEERAALLDFKALEQWRQGLRVGSVLDARDGAGRWHCATVVELHDKNPKSQFAELHHNNAQRVRMVHFEGWGERFDEVKDLVDDAHSLAPRFAVTQNWRIRLAVGDPIGESLGVSRWVHARAKFRFHLRDACCE